MKSFEQHISELPLFLGKEIFEYVFYSQNNINFSDFHPTCCDTNYNPKYKIACKTNTQRLCKNISNNLYLLSRINKKNGKYRYYITKEISQSMCNGCGSYKCNSRYCRGSFNNEYYYSSKYIGNNLDIALLKFYLLN